MLKDPLHRAEELVPRLDMLMLQYQTFCTGSGDNDWEPVLYQCYEIARIIYPSYDVIIDNIATVVAMIASEQPNEAIELLGELYGQSSSEFTDWEFSGINE